jgi:hypothetical protein
MTAPRIREAVAVFDNSERLERAISELQSHGVDRADLSFVAHQALTGRRYDDMHRLADDPAAPREAVVSDTDLRQGRVLGTGLAATVAALTAAGFTVITGGAGAAAIAAVAAAGGVGGVSTLVGRKLAEDEESFLDAQLARGGVILWVRIQDADAERLVLEVLRRHSPDVHLHDWPVEETTPQQYRDDCG